MSNICVIHLVRQINGIEPTIRFIESYCSHAAGVDHELLILFKGFDNEQVPNEYASAFKNCEYKTLFIDDVGFDIDSYFIAAKSVNQRFLCFLNSFSVILADNWLQKMYSHIVRSKVGVVGATGSNESTYTNNCKFVIPSAHLSFKRRILESWIQLDRILGYKRGYPAFPNYHIRTNAFMLSRKLMLALQINQYATREDVMKFESGKNSLTRQILANRLEVLVIGRDGNAYSKQNWHGSKTFRSGNQSNLLIADNRTYQYQEANEEEKRRLEKFAWG